MGELEEKVEILNPQEPKCATVLLLDTSASMTGEKIKGLNHGIKLFKEEIIKDELARKRVELAIVKFGGDVEEKYFSAIEEYEPEEYTASGNTPMGEAILKAIELIEKRKNEYRESGVEYYRPWIFLITDGEPTDMQEGDELWNEVINKVHTGEKEKKFLFFAVGVENANIEILKKIGPPNRPPVKLKGLAFKELFLWLSKSQSRVSASRTDETVKLPSIEGWAEI